LWSTSSASAIRRPSAPGWRALAVLSPRDAALVRLLFAEPAPSYAEISQRLGLAVGSIGPTRGRCLEQLARNAALRAHVDAPPAE
jgi:hypothetical protein